QRLARFAMAAHIRCPGNWLACFTHVGISASTPTSVPILLGSEWNSVCALRSRSWRDRDCRRSTLDRTDEVHDGDDVVQYQERLIVVEHWIWVGETLLVPHSIKGIDGGQGVGQYAPGHLGFHAVIGFEPLGIFPHHAMRRLVAASGDRVRGANLPEV